MAWTEARTELLKKLWADGMSCSQIAMRIGGVSRNAVIGRVYRLKLPGRKTLTRSPTRLYRRVPKQPRASKPRIWNPVQKLKTEPWIAQPEPVIPAHERKPILIRKNGCLHANEALKEDSCRWPCGDTTDPDFGFCGRTKVPGIPYCEQHARIAYRALNPTPPAASQVRAEVVQESQTSAAEKVAA